MTSKRTFVAFLAFLINVVYSEAIPNSRIFGGADASAGIYPWVASVRVNGIHACSGCIVNNKYIITAGHCVATNEGSQITARIGSINQYAGGQIVNIASVVIHPSYGNFLHDIALLKLDQTVTFSDTIDKIPLATEDDIIEEGTPISVAGWGLQESGSSPYKLQHLSFSVLNRKLCEFEVGYGYDSVICLAHPERTGICRGDGGAGIVSGMKLVGVASFSFGSCGTKYPDISSSIPYYSKWINSVIE